MTFEEIWKIVGRGAILSENKARLIYSDLQQVRRVPGALCEIGVYKGNTAKLMKMSCPDRDLYLYDTFKGIVMANSARDVHVDGEFNETNLEDVQKYVGVDETTFYREGMFPETFTESDLKFAFVHSDTDTYFGTMETLEVVLPLVSPGGILVFDDYKWQNCPGVEQALSEYLSMNTTYDLRTQERDYQFAIIKVD